MSRRARRGSNTIEFALVSPVLIGLITAVMDYSWLFALRFAATTAAQIGAREGAFTDQDADPDGTASAAALARWEGFGLPATPTIVAFRSGTPELMVVRLEVDTEPLIGFVAGPTSFEVTRVRRMEDQP